MAAEPRQQLCGARQHGKVSAAKIDRLDGDRAGLLNDPVGVNRIPPLAISAVTGEGIPVLLDHIETRIAGELARLEITLPPDKLGLTDFLYRRGTVVGRHDNEDGSISMELLATEAARDEIEGRLGRPAKG